MTQVSTAIQTFKPETISIQKTSNYFNYTMYIDLILTIQNSQLIRITVVNYVQLSVKHLDLSKYKMKVKFSIINTFDIKLKRGS